MTTMTEWVDTQTGELRTEPTELDACIARLDALKRAEAEVREQRIALEIDLAKRAEALPGETKTRRVAGVRWAVKVQLRDYEKWDQRTLEQIRERIGVGTFEKYFRVGEYKPNVREMQKLRGTAGEPETLYYEFMGALTRTPGKPQVTIETAPDQGEI
jgi:hypothetical protein